MLSRLLLAPRLLAPRLLAPRLQATRQYNTTSHKLDDDVLEDYLSGFGGVLLVGLLGSVGYIAYNTHNEREIRDNNYRLIEKSNHDAIMRLLRQKKSMNESIKKDINDLRKNNNYNYLGVTLDDFTFDRISENLSDQFIIDMVGIDYYNMRYIPKMNYSQELFDKVVSISKNLEYVPEEYQTRELCEICVSYNPYQIKFVKHPYTDLFIKTINQDASSIKNVNPKFQTLELWKVAITKNPKMIFGCPVKTYRLWMVAYLNDATIIKKVTDLRIKYMLKTISISRMTELIDEKKYSDEYIENYVKHILQ